MALCCNRVLSWASTGHASWTQVHLSRALLHIPGVKERWAALKKAASSTPRGRAISPLCPATPPRERCISLDKVHCQLVFLRATDSFHTRVFLGLKNKKNTVSNSIQWYSIALVVSRFLILHSIFFMWFVEFVQLLCFYISCVSTAIIWVYSFLALCKYLLLKRDITILPKN